MVIAGLLIIVVLLVLILSKKMSALLALILVPVVGALLAGFGWNTFDFAIAGIKSMAPVIAMFVFAILFFSILSDAGMFDPIIKGILKRVGTHPAWIAVGTAVLAMTVHFDGSGATTFLIAIPALLPLYEKLGMDRRVLACIVSLAAGTMNMVPWGGPTIRAAGALEVSVNQIYAPLLVPQIGGLLFVLLIAWWLGRKEAKRLGPEVLNAAAGLTASQIAGEVDAEKEKLRRPKLFWFNVLITIIVLVFMIAGLVPPALAFMLGLVLVLLLNYPDQKSQKDRIFAHSEAALLMAGILLAAGVFTGILKESGMIKEMAESAIQIIPNSAGEKLPVLLAIFSMPLSFVFDPDSFYYGFLPILAKTGAGFGVAEVTMGQAALLGQMTTGFPLSPLTASTFLLIGLSDVSLEDHQRFTFKYAFGVTLVMTLIAILVGVIPI